MNRGCSLKKITDAMHKALFKDNLTLPFELYVFLLCIMI